MIDFKDITLEDKEIITSFIFPNDCCNCEFSFSNLISWRFLYNTKYAVVDDFLQGFLEFHLSIIRHSVQLVVKAFVHQLVEGFSKDIGFPDLFCIVFKFV